MAIGALKGLREAGLRVPQDVALVGFDDVPAASVIEPTLTTVRQPIERLGSTAEVLLSVLEGLPEEEPSVHRAVLSTELAGKGLLWFYRLVFVKKEVMKSPR